MEKFVLEICGKDFSSEEIYKSLVQKKWRKNDGKPITDLDKTLLGISRCSNKLRFLTKEKRDSIISRKRKREFASNTKPRIVSKDSGEEKFSSYKEQLNDERWKAFREFVFFVRGRRCEVCGETKRLQVHHLRYKKNTKAWEYTCNDVIVVCDQCHRKIHGIKQ